MEWRFVDGARLAGFAEYVGPAGCVQLFCSNLVEDTGDNSPDFEVFVAGYFDRFVSRVFWQEPNSVVPFEETFYGEFTVYDCYYDVVVLGID